jgi:hypothetical protein
MLPRDFILWHANGDDDGPLVIEIGQKSYGTIHSLICLSALPVWADHVPFARPIAGRIEAAWGTSGAAFRV